MQTKKETRFYTSNTPLYVRGDCLSFIRLKRVSREKLDTSSLHFFNSNISFLKSETFYRVRTNIHKLINFSEERFPVTRALFITDTNQTTELLLGVGFTIYLDEKDDSLLGQQSETIRNLEGTFQPVPPVLLEINKISYYEREWRWYNRFSACKKIPNIIEYLKENKE